ncbi:ribonuclease H-like domain-containing protein [Xylaria arbuscula]|nr:ribonuclease H-like domain-containing protein [Xylaria arbuscula]
MHDILEFYLLDSKRRATDRYPAVPVMPESDDASNLPRTLNPYNPENRAPPAPTDPVDPVDPVDPKPGGRKKVHKPKPPQKSKALVIDCEMVRLAGSEQDLVRIGVVDFYTGKVVLDKLVRPTGPVTNWRYEVTRLNKYILREAAKKKGKVISGWEKAREMIFEVATSETVFIGHALSNDLRVLRIATDRVVDTMTIMSTAVYGDRDKFPRNWSLKTGCEELVGLAVQKTSKHEALEDALATRELALRCILNPTELGEWAEDKRAKLAQIEQKEHEKAVDRQSRRPARDVLKRVKKAEKVIRKIEASVQGAAQRAKDREEKKWRDAFLAIRTEPEVDTYGAVWF